MLNAFAMLTTLANTVAVLNGNCCVIAQCRNRTVRHDVSVGQCTIMQQLLTQSLPCRTLLNLRTLSHQLAPVMHDYRPQLIDQAQHAANTAAAVSAFASPLASTIPNSPCSPFADVEDAFSPTLPQGSSDRQERRREISGSLPLEQILSRLPSSSAAACDQHVAEEGPSQFPSRRTSRLGASLDISRLLYRAYSHLMVDADSAADLPTGQPAPVWSSGSPRGSAGGGVTRTEGYQNEGTTARLGEGMTSLLASGLGFLDSLQENLTVEHSQPPITNPTAGSRRPLGLAEPAEGSMQEAQLQAEVEARSRGQQHRQHPWLLYFYDRQTERDYGRYHAQQMAMVRAGHASFCVGCSHACFRSRGLNGGSCYIHACTKCLRVFLIELHTMYTCTCLVGGSCIMMLSPLLLLLVFHLYCASIQAEPCVGLGVDSFPG